MGWPVVHRSSGVGIARFSGQRLYHIKCASNMGGSPSSGEMVSEMEGSKMRRTSVTLSEATRPPSSRFKVLQWNVLADGLAQSGDFINVPPEILEWRFRAPLVLQELTDSEADIICLQEVNHYDELLLALGGLGYAGGFFPKPCSPAERYNCPADGLAIFYKETRFKLIEHMHGQAYSDPEGHQQSQCFMYAKLHDIAENQDLVVCTTHLKAKEGEVENVCRVRQVKQLLTALGPVLAPPAGAGAAGSGNGVPESNSSNGSQAASSGLGTVLPVVLTGDFNTTPGSPPCLELMAHPAGFQSIWDIARLPANGTSESTPSTEFSTWKFRSKGESKRIIDHLWFSNGHLMAPVSRWRMLNDEEIGPNGLPSSQYPSDHIALRTEFEWRTESGVAAKECKNGDS